MPCVCAILHVYGVCVRVCVWVCACLCVCVCVCMHACVCACMCACVSVYKFTCIMLKILQAMSEFSGLRKHWNNAASTNNIWRMVSLLESVEVTVKTLKAINNTNNILESNLLAFLVDVPKQVQMRGWQTFQVGDLLSGQHKKVKLSLQNQSEVNQPWHQSESVKIVKYSQSDSE